MTITLPRLKIISPGGVFSAAGVNAAINRQKANLENVVNGVQGFDALLWNNSTATLATDTLSLTGKPRVLVIDTEGSASTDNLSTISNGTAYQQLWLKAADAGRVITVKHNVGNIKLWNAVDVALTSTNWLHLFYDGTQWSDNAPPVTPPTQGFVINTARTVLGADATSVTISSIPATYKHLLLIVEMRTDTASTSDNVFLQFNADTGANYYAQRYAAGTAVEALATTGITIQGGAVGSLGSAGNGMAVIWISNYASTTMRRNINFHCYGHVANTAGGARYGWGGANWINTTDAISSIKLSPASGTNILANSAYTLYGLN